MPDPHAEKPASPPPAAGQSANGTLPAEQKAPVIEQKLPVPTENAAPAPPPFWNRVNTLPYYKASMETG